MTITGTPASYPKPGCGEPQVPPPLVPVLCQGQNILSAPISTFLGKPILSRMRAIQIQGGQLAVIDWTLHDYQGNPVDLNGCMNLPGSSAALNELSSFSSSDGSAGLDVERGPYEVHFRFREDLAVGRAPWPTEKDWAGKVVDAAQGKVQVTIPGKDLGYPGVYFAEMALTARGSQGEQFLLFSNTFYLIVNRGNWQQTRTNFPMGPPSIAEIRLHLRDSGAAENLLLDSLRFDDAEIALAISRPIMEWNEVPPPLTPMSTRNFPFRFHWLEAICGNLFLMVAEQYRANHLQYQAAGIAVDDQNKAPDYDKAAQMRLQTWRSFMQRKKVSMNMALMYRSLGSTYFWEGAYYY